MSTQLSSRESVPQLLFRPRFPAPARNLCDLIAVDCQVDALRGALARDEILLHEKDALIRGQETLHREPDHRLLNGLQMVVNPLSLQSRAAPIPGMAARPSIAANRVATIALVWPEKVGLVAALVIAVLSAIVCATVLLAADTVSFSRLNHVLAVWSGMAELTVALPTWLLMRGIDFAANGPARRRAVRKSHFEY